MIIGREKELHTLSEMHSSKNFRFLVMYGRHRVGKTSLLREFAKKKDAIYFTPQVKNNQLNLADFSEVLHQHFDKGSFGTFQDWENAFAFLTSKLTGKRFTIIIEDFHHLVAEQPSIIRLLQATIDRSWRTKNVFLIVSDSDASFIENELLGYDSPLYGRITDQMVVTPLDYLECAKFLPGYSAEDKLVAYGILGGVPCYAQQFDSSIPIADNIVRHILHGGAFLNGEPQAVLGTDFRDLAVYNSILEAIASGLHKMNDVSRRIGEESQKCAKYLHTLRMAWLVDKITPVGEDELSKKSLYMLSDNFTCFWYRFIFRNRSQLELKEPEAAAQEILQSDSFHIYIEETFSNVCREYLVKKARAGKLPFAPYAIGKWWSGSSKSKKSHNIDLVALDKDRTSVIFGGCKFKDSPFDETDLSELMAAAKSFGKISETYYYLFSKSGYSDEVKEQSKKIKNIKFLELEDLFKI